MIVILAPSGISFDDSIHRLLSGSSSSSSSSGDGDGSSGGSGSGSGLNEYLDSNIIGLTAWSSDGVSSSGSGSGGDGSGSDGNDGGDVAVLALRTDIIDAWVFKPSQLMNTHTLPPTPLPLVNSNIVLGDRKLSSHFISIIKASFQMNIINPSFAVQAVNVLKSSLQIDKREYYALGIDDGALFTIV